jgi:thiamine pyrophosphate-dependent acetolactate synthase large subunit-like protein
MNIRDAFFEVLGSHGITTIFGCPGSNELPLLRDFPDDSAISSCCRRARRSGWRMRTH